MKLCRDCKHYSMAHGRNYDECVREVVTAPDPVRGGVVATGVHVCIFERAAVTGCGEAAIYFEPVRTPMRAVQS